MAAVVHFVVAAVADIVTTVIDVAAAVFNEK